MSRTLPTSNFRFMIDDEIRNLDIIHVPNDNPRGICWKLI